ncbi:MarR family winged helix-turn-helix transcriptional regulator [Nocardioides sp. MAHUQ-72]|uniref:MarR family winged helix-turn-helix transcriptional regulator n=1 Tax=unclassified Nocardioides TaxID=2615069 RepID=UPI0036081797
MATDDTPWLDVREQQVWRAWLALGSRLPAALNRQLQRDSDLSLQDFDVLVQLTESDEGRVRVSGLAAALGWERSRLSHHVTRMERRGLVAREDCDDDGRGAFVVLTPAGREAIEAAAPGHVRTVRGLFLDALTPAEVEALGAAMAKVLDRL